MVSRLDSLVETQRRASFSPEEGGRVGEGGRFEEGRVEEDRVEENCIEEGGGHIEVYYLPFLQLWILILDSSGSEWWVVDII